MDERGSGGRPEFTDEAFEFSTADMVFYVDRVRQVAEFSAKQLLESGAFACCQYLAVFIISTARVIEHTASTGVGIGRQPLLYFVGDSDLDWEINHFTAASQTSAQAVYRHVFLRQIAIG